MTSLLVGKCNLCNALILDEVLGAQNFVICKQCGAKLDPLFPRGNIMKGKAWRSEMSKSKGLLFKQELGFRQQRNRAGAPVRHERLVDRVGNRYYEKVTIEETGEIIHHSDEPLSEHIGHGSDQKEGEQ